MPGVVSSLGLRPLGPLPSSTRLTLVLGLPLRNQQALSNLLAQIYDPASPDYHHYLTPRQFAERFGPTEQDYQALAAFAVSHGLSVVGHYANRTLLDVEGAAGDVEKAFHTTLSRYPHPTEARTFYAPDSQPWVESPTRLLDVAGLNDFHRPHPKDLLASTLRQGQRATPKDGSGPSGAYLPADLRAAYLPGVSLTGLGQAVALMEFDGYYANDIASYESLAGWPAIPLQNVLLDGFNGKPTTGPNSGSSEVSLDIEMAIALAPGLSQVLVYEAGPYGSGNDVLNRMATDDLAKQISCSWDFDVTASTDQILQQMAAQGQSFFNASGDDGAYVGAIPAPDDDPYMTIVGGTTLATRNAKGGWLSETTWNWGAQGVGTGSSGGGISTSYSIPAWQQGIDMSANQGSTTMRNIPDVAMVADGLWIVYNNGRSSSFGGTSCAAPLWAGLAALVNQQAAASGRPPVGFFNPALYSIAKSSAYTSTFHDVKTGNNTTSASPSRFYATAGYDLCTGLGTPAGQPLIDALAGASDSLRIIPQAGFDASGPIGGPFTTTSETFSLANSGDASLNWAAASLASWLAVAPAGGALQPAPVSATVTVSLTGADALAAGTYSGAVWFTNFSTGAAQARQFTLRVGQNLIRNGGFETGDLSDWSLAGTSANTRVVSNAGSQPWPELVHSGVYGVRLSQVVSLAYLSQSLPTSAGQNYLLSLWLTNPYSGDTPNEFQVKWSSGGVTNILFDEVNMAQFGWTNMEFAVAAGGATSALSFGSRNDPQAFGLDDISVMAIPTLTFKAAMEQNARITLTWSSLPGLLYQPEYRTNLTQGAWTALGGPITATAAQTSASDPIEPNGRRFYRVVLAQ
jgi:Pro-kumamolisin, activation domain/Viral BACON domain